MGMSNAPQAAVDAAAQFKGTAIRAVDTEYNATCWIAFEGDSRAVVIYDDEPDCVVSTGNHHGRFSKASTNGA